MPVRQDQTVTKSRDDVDNLLTCFPSAMYFSKFCHLRKLDVVLPTLSELIVTHGKQSVSLGPDKAELKTSHCLPNLKAF